MSGAQRLGAVISEIIDRYGYRDQIDAVRAVETWAYLAGPQINRVTEKVWVKSGKLVVELNSAAWRQQLHMQRGDWCERLNAELGAEVIDEIVFR
jgi:predicted nucleic acid-binding Zn ribbon protein